MKPTAVAGRIQPTERRVASSTSRIVRPPSTTSTGSRVGGAIDEAAEVDDRPGERADRRRRPASSRAHGPRPEAPAPRGKQQKDQNERDEQKADAIDLRLNDEEHPVERIERQADREHRRDATRSSLERTSLRFLKGFEGFRHHARESVSGVGCGPIGFLAGHCRVGFCSA